MNQDDLKRIGLAPSHIETLKAVIAKGADRIRASALYKHLGATSVFASPHTYPLQFHLVTPKGFRSVHLVTPSETAPDGVVIGD